MKLQFNESQASETKYTEACWTNYPTCEAKWGYVQQPKLALGFIPVISAVRLISKMEITGKYSSISLDNIHHLGLFNYFQYC
jgi:hypothetical protein